MPNREHERARLVRGRTRWWPALVLCLCAALGLGCEEVSHENIDKWMRTQKGPGKLVDAFEDRSLDADLSAHAGQNLVRMDRVEDVVRILEDMPAERRAEVLAALAPRLWEDARIEGEMTVPSPAQIMAKDALFDVRRSAGDETRAQIDGYLSDWLTEGYYSARARVGRVRGATIVRALGERAASGLLRRAKSLLAAKPGEDDNTRFQLEDPLLLGLAATGHADAAGLLLDMMTLEHPDKSLAGRAMDALYMGYVKNDGLFEVADGKALVPHVERLAELALDPDRDNKTVNDAIRLIGVAGAPACVQPLVRVMADAHGDMLRWVAANAALQCGKADALGPVADALPARGAYAEKEILGAIVEPLLAVEEDTAAVAQKARTLLQSRSWVARIIGVELLARLKQAENAAADAALLRGLAKDKTRLRGWWGDQSDLPKRERKPEPRLGERALGVAAALDPTAKSG